MIAARQFVPPASPRSASQPADAAALDIVFIEGFVGETVIGIHESELHRAQTLVIDVHAGVPHAAACDTDHIRDTIDYGVVCERLRGLLREHRLQLLEALAETIGQILLDEFGACWVRVKVVKPRKFDDVQAVGVQIERTASPTARHGSADTAASSAHSAAVLQLLGSGMVPGAR